MPPPARLLDRADNRLHPYGDEPAVRAVDVRSPSERAPQERANPAAARRERAESDPFRHEPGRTPGERFAAGDPLRAIAALTVLAYHCALAATFSFDQSRLAMAYSLPLGGVLSALNGGLYLFFTLSGFLIAGPFIRAFVDGQPLPGTGQYVRARLLRIVPAYWAVLTALLLLYRGGDGSVGSWLAAYAFAIDYQPSTVTHKVSQAWTLGVELAFYASVPVVAAAVAATGSRLRRRNRIRLVAAVTVAIGVASLIARELAPETLLWRRSAPLMMAAFVPGALLALLRVAARSRAGVLSRRPLPTLAAVAGLVMIFAADHAGPAAQHNGAALAPALASLGSALIVGACLVTEWAGKPAPKALDNRLLHWIGKRSYSVYLVHLAILLELARHWPGAPLPRLCLLLALTIPLTLLVSALSYRFVERPFMRLKEREARAPATTG